MTSETRAKLLGFMRLFCGLLKRILIALWRISERILRGIYNLLQVFCESRKVVSSAKAEAQRANAELNMIRMHLDQTERAVNNLRDELTKARNDAESSRAKISHILRALKRRKQALGDLLKHNLLHDEKPKGIIIDETINAWWKDFLDSLEDGEEDGDDESDNEAEEDEDDENEEYDDGDDEGNDEEEDEDDEDEEYDDGDDEGDEEEESDNYGGKNSSVSIKKDDDGPEHEFDPTRKGSDLDQAFLETANNLFERLDELPKKCDRFKVRFVAANSDNWIQPEEWHQDDDGSLIFGCMDDGENHDDEELTIADLKDILTGGRDDDDTEVDEDTLIYIDDPESVDFFRPLDEYFKIRWKQRRVEIPMIEDYEEEEEDDEEDDDNEDEDDDEDDNEDEDDEGEDDGDEDEDDEDEDEDDEDEDDDEGDDEDEDEDDCASSRNTHNRPPCDLTFGLIMERGFNQWKSGR